MASMESDQQPKVDSEGCVTCPQCGFKKKCGTGGAGNILKNHTGTKTCKEAKAKRDKAGKKTKDGSLLSFLQPRPTLVPATVHAEPVQQVAAIKGPTSLSSQPGSREGWDTLTKSPFARYLRKISDALPASVPEATQTDALACFENPAAQDNLEILSEDLWEELLNPFLKDKLGWGDTNLEAAIRRGRLGLEAVADFVQYFVEERGVDEALFEGKMENLVEWTKKLTASPTGSTGCPLAITPLQGVVLDVDGDIDDEPIEIITAGARAIIDVDGEGNDKLIDITTPRTRSATELAEKKERGVRKAVCEGYVLDLPGGLSPHRAYPFGLHDLLPLPWDYAIRNGVMTLFARRCRESCDSAQACCQACRDLRKNEILEGILDRMKHGIRESTNFLYHGIDGLIQLLDRKSNQIHFHRLQGLNHARGLLRKAAVLDNHKRFLLAIASGKVVRIDRLVRIALGQKKGIQAILMLIDSAAKGVYRPKSFDEEDELQSLYLWRMGGNRLASFGNKALGLLSVSALRTRTIVPPIIPSYGKPTTLEIEANIEGSFESVMDVVRAEGGILHAVLMLDEIATEKRIRLNHKGDYFLGVCRQHGHRTSLQFVNTEDMEELFRSLDDGEVHYAAEATVGAIGILCENNRIYPARAVLISGDCKKETGKEHMSVLQTALDGIHNKCDFIDLRIVSISSDGEKRRGSALAQLTFRNLLGPQSNIYGLLSPLVFMDLHAGFDDLTADKDWKHVFKRIRNLALRERGIVIRFMQGIFTQDIRITPSITRTHFTAEGATQDHIRASFNPKDLQDVCIAFTMLKDIWLLPRNPTLLAVNNSAGYSNAREALWIFGQFLHYLVFPYVCIDLSLSEQLEYLSAAAHLCLLLYHRVGKDFLPTELYVDIMIMIKNVYFCVAKAKVDNPNSSFHIILLGTDRLEELFGILRTMVGNNVNLDILQLSERLSGTTEVSNILAKHPEWDRAPRRTNLKPMTRTSGEITAKSDHLKPSSWRGNVKLANVSLLTSWRCGRRLIEDTFPESSAAFNTMEAKHKATILSPFGKLLVNVPLPVDDVDESIEDIFHPLPPTFTASADFQSDQEIRVLVEDGLAAELERYTAGSSDKTNRKIIYKGQEMSKEKALGLRGRERYNPGSTDQLRRVRGDDRHVGSASIDEGSGDPDDKQDSDSCLVISDPIASLLKCDGRVWLCIGEVNGIKKGGKAIDCVSEDVLVGSSNLSVSYQILGMRPANSDDDPKLKFDWRTYSVKERTLTVPGHLIQLINPETSNPNLSLQDPVFYLLDSRMLVALAASIFESLGASDLKLIPKVDRSDNFPYREKLGKACFLSQSSSHPAHVHELTNDADIECPLCTTPSISLDLSHGQRILEHLGAHILFDEKVIRTEEPCGLCLRPAALCPYYLKKGRGRDGKMRIDKDRLRNCPMKTNLKYSVAVASTPSSPCSNIPICCPLCNDPHEPAVWRYNMKYHFSRVHPNVKGPQLQKYAHLWELSDSEIVKMKEKWADRQRVVVKCAKKSKLPPLVISEAHRSHIPSSNDRGMGKESETHVGNDSDSDDEEFDEETSDKESDLDNAEDVMGPHCAHQMPEMADMTLTEDSVGNDMSTAGGRIGATHAGVNFMEAENLALSSECINVDVPVEEVLSAPQTENLPSSSSSEPIEQPEVSEQRAHRKRRAVEVLYECDCGLQVDASAEDAIQCKRKGCETIWYHLGCIRLDEEAKKWVCIACKASSGGKGRKAARR